MLKKPSDYFKKEKTIIDNGIQELVKAPELNTFSDSFESFKDNLSKIEILSEFSETLNNYRVNIDKVNYLSEKVEDIQTEVQTLLKKEDLDRVMMSQLLVVEQSIRDVQSKVKGINEKNLAEIRLDVSGLAESVNEFLKIEVPQYKRLIIDSELRTDNRFSKLEENINQTLEDIGEFVDDKYQELTENFQDIAEQSLAGTLQDFTDLIGTINCKIDDVNQLSKQVKFTEQNTEDYKNTIKKKVSDLEIDIIRNETHIRVQNKNLEAIQEEVKQTLGKINLEELENQNHKLGKKIKYIEEIFEKFSEKDILAENIIVEPPSTDNKDPLTPLDQNFVTLDQLQDHYRLFINRIQQQLATIGGGGETRLKYLDDIVGISTNASAYDGKFLKYDHGIGKFEFVTVSGGGNVAIAITNIPPINPSEGNLWYDSDIGRTFIYYTDIDGSQWVDANPSGGTPQTGAGTDAWITTSVGIHTLSSVGIGTTNPTSKLTVSGGDIRVGINTSEGVILTSPNNIKYRLIVDDSGILSTVLVP